jgi:hypothetical protein
MGRAFRWMGVLLALGFVAAACTGGPATKPSAPSASSSIPSSPNPSGPAAGAALVSHLPKGCAGVRPRADATVAFVAGGRAWAVTPEGTELACLFKVSDPGPFEWGPRADRVLMEGLAVRGVGSNAFRPPGAAQPTLFSWSRPKGTAVAFIDAQGTKVEEALVGSRSIQDVTPFDIATYQGVVYHPSGLALALVLTDPNGSQVWMTSNRGTDQTRIVWSREGTIFGPLAFRFDGNTLYYGARLANGTRVIAGVDLRAGRLLGSLWTGRQDVLRMASSPDGGMIALDTGTGCTDRKALLSQGDGTHGETLLPGSKSPTSVVGWLDEDHVLVSEGGCGQRAKLWVVGARSGVGVSVPATLLAANVDRAAVRVPDPTPPPPLPKIHVKDGFG